MLFQYASHHGNGKMLIVRTTSPTQSFTSLFVNYYHIVAAYRNFHSLFREKYGSLYYIFIEFVRNWTLEKSNGNNGNICIII